MLDDLIQKLKNKIKRAISTHGKEQKNNDLFLQSILKEFYAENSRTIDRNFSTLYEYVNYIQAVKIGTDLSDFIRKTHEEDIGFFGESPKFERATSPEHRVFLCLSDVLYRFLPRLERYEPTGNSNLFFRHLLILPCDISIELLQKDKEESFEDHLNMPLQDIIDKYQNFLRSNESELKSFWYNQTTYYEKKLILQKLIKTCSVDKNDYLTFILSRVLALFNGLELNLAEMILKARSIPSVSQELKTVSQDLFFMPELISTVKQVIRSHGHLLHLVYDEPNFSDRLDILNYANKNTNASIHPFLAVLVTAQEKLMNSPSPRMGAKFKQ